MAVGSQVAELAKLDNARGFHSFGEVKFWHDSGASAETILDVVRTVASRENYPANPSLRYFRPAMLRAIEEAKASAPDPVDPVREAPFVAFNRAYDAWIANGRAGDPPMMPGIARAA